MQDGGSAHVRGAVSVHGEDRRALDGADGFLRRLGHVPLAALQRVLQRALVVPVERLAVGRENREKEREREGREGRWEGAVLHFSERGGWVCHDYTAIRYTSQ